MRERLSPEERRKQLLTVANECFHEKGYTETTVSELVKRAGVAKGTFFYYFPTKESILTAIMEEECHVKLAELQVRTQGQGALERLHAITGLVEEEWQIDAIVDHLYISGDMRLVMYLWQVLQQKCEPLLIDVIEQGVREKTFVVHNIPLAINYIWAILDGYFAYSEKAPHESEESLALTNELIHYMLGVNT